MTTRTEIINGKEVTVITADEGKTFQRKWDNLEVGNEIYLGVDYSTGKALLDKAENYEEVIILIEN